MPTPDNKTPWWMDGIKTLGVPTSFLIALVYMIWMAGSWAGNTVVVPIFNKQMDFIDKASAMTQEMSRTTALINKTLEAHGEHAIENLKTCQRVEEICSKTATDVKVMSKSHDQILGVLQSIDQNTKPLR